MDEIIYKKIHELISQKAGLKFINDKNVFSSKGVDRAFTQSDFTSLTDYYQFLASNDCRHLLWEYLISEITVGESSFFRNHYHTTVLTREIFPCLLDSVRERKKSLRIWSAGCSCGQEPYTLAIILNELKPYFPRVAVHILATDINNISLQKAKKGIYTQWDLRNMEKTLVDRYFEQKGQHYHLKPKIKEMVNFNYLNLAEDVYPSYLTHTSELDLIICRNVTIYFNEKVTLRVINNFHNCLATDGWLIVGHSEHNSKFYCNFETVTFENAQVYHKKPPKSPVSPEDIFGKFIDRGTAINGRRHTAAIDHLGSLVKTPSPVFNINRQPKFSKDDLKLRQPSIVEYYIKKCELNQTLAADEVMRLQCLLEIERGEENAEILQFCYYLLAHLLADKSHYKEAIAVCEMITRENLLLAHVYHLMAFIWEELDDHDTAVKALRKCLYAAPDFVLGHYQMAKIYTKMNNCYRATIARRNLYRLLRDINDDECIIFGEGTTASWIRKEMELDNLA